MWRTERRPKCRSGILNDNAVEVRGERERQHACYGPKTHLLTLTLLVHDKIGISRCLYRQGLGLYRDIIRGIVVVYLEH